MAPVRRLVADVLKPHDPPLLEFTDRIAELECVSGVTATLIELDREVENVSLAVEGDAVDYGTVEATVEELGGTVHSVDQVSCGEHVVEDRTTRRDG